MRMSRFSCFMSICRKTMSYLTLFTFIFTFNKDTGIIIKLKSILSFCNIRDYVPFVSLFIWKKAMCLN